MFNFRSMVYDTKNLVDSQSPSNDPSLVQNINKKDCKRESLNSSHREIMIFRGVCVV